MSYSQNWNRTGEQFKDALSEALQGGDFGNLNRLVTQTVNSVLEDAGIHIPYGNGPSGNSRRNPQPDDSPRRQDFRGRPGSGGQREQFRRTGQQSYSRANGGAALPVVKMNRVGGVSGVLCLTFGGIGLGISLFVALMRLFILMAPFGARVPFALGGWAVNLAFTAFFFGMIYFGNCQRQRLKRAERYARLCSGRMFGQVELLAKNTGKNVRYVARDIQKMLRLGIFPEGHLDEQKTCFMLNDTVYRQYLEAEESRRRRESAEREGLGRESPGREKDGREPDASAAGDADGRRKELDAMLAEGMEYVRELRELNDCIPGERISDKLLRLENLLKEIFDRIREHPEQMHRMHKLMDYYLPTTVKLVEAYEEFDQVSAPGDEIVRAKEEIENTLDTINQAFTELLNNLFQDAVFDATTDAQVLKTMLAREGLTDEMKAGTGSI